jgi:hypothetical protein
MRSAAAGACALLLAAACGLALADAPPQDDDRGVELYAQWLPARLPQVQAFEGFLRQEKVADVVPTWQLLRSASMWKECHAPPFDIPPAASWPAVRDVLQLMQELRRGGILGPFSVVSAYRDPPLNRCAGGSRRSSHMLFAVDIITLAPTDGPRLCAFWRDQGKRWNMGLSRYPSGRIHVDRTGWRTWGADYTRHSSFCEQLATARPKTVRVNPQARQ